MHRQVKQFACQPTEVACQRRFDVRWKGSPSCRGSTESDDGVPHLAWIPGTNDWAISVP